MWLNAYYVSILEDIQSIIYLRVCASIAGKLYEDIDTKY